MCGILGAVPRKLQCEDMLCYVMFSYVGDPVEGTMLTVMRVTSESMIDSVTRLGLHPSDLDIVEVLENGLQVCEQAVMDTQKRLPILQNAGVVDAGGKGFELIIRGFLAELKGEDPHEIILDWATTDTTISKEFLANSQEQIFGYCTQVLFSGTTLNPESIRSELMKIAIIICFAKYYHRLQIAHVNNIKNFCNNIIW